MPRLWLEGTLKCCMLGSTVDGRLQIDVLTPRELALKYRLLWETPSGPAIIGLRESFDLPT